MEHPGMAAQVARSDFEKARRRAALSRLARRLRGQAGDVSTLLSLEEVLAALSQTGQRRLGLQTISLDSIVGSVDRAKEFDHRFRPRSEHVRTRWQGINVARRSGVDMPPIDVYRVGELHFVRDGHHRVSVARHMGLDVIDAHVTEILTRVEPGARLTLADLPAKSHERLFVERVPLTAEQLERISFSKPERGFGELAENVEAWGFRLIQGLGEPLNRRDVARAWFEDEYEPVVAALRDADLIGKRTEADAYLRMACIRYQLLRTYEWGDEVIARLREELD